MAATTVLVTGSTRGIGRRAVERLLTERQYRVIMTARSEDSGMQAFREISALGNFGDRLVFHQLDVTSQESVDALKAWIGQTFGQIDVLVNNAGVATKGPDFNEEIARFTLGTNFYATVNVTECLLPVVKQGGHIVLVSSNMGQLSRLPGEALRQRLMNPTMTVADVRAIADEFMASVSSGAYEQLGWARSTYIASKNLLNAYARVKARDCTGQVRISAVHPGWVRTDMGGPTGALSLDEGTETLLAAIDYSGTETGTYWHDGILDRSW